MKKIALFATLGLAAFFSACSDDSSSSSGGSSACLFTSPAPMEGMEGSRSCLEGPNAAIEALCLGSDFQTAEKMGSCPSGATVSCEEQGVTTYMYNEGAVCF